MWVVSWCCGEAGVVEWVVDRVMDRVVARVVSARSIAGKLVSGCGSGCKQAAAHATEPRRPTQERFVGRPRVPAAPAPCRPASYPREIMHTCGPTRTLPLVSVSGLTAQTGAACAHQQENAVAEFGFCTARRQHHHGSGLGGVFRRPLVCSSPREGRCTGALYSPQAGHIYDYSKCNATVPRRCVPARY